MVVQYKTMRGNFVNCLVLDRMYCIFGSNNIPVMINRCSLLLGTSLHKYVGIISIKFNSCLINHLVSQAKIYYHYYCVALCTMCVCKTEYILKCILSDNNLTISPPGTSLHKNNSFNQRVVSAIALKEQTKRHSNLNFIISILINFKCNGLSSQLYNLFTIVHYQ